MALDRDEPPTQSKPRFRSRVRLRRRPPRFRSGRSRSPPPRTPRSPRGTARDPARSRYARARASRPTGRRSRTSDPPELVEAVLRRQPQRTRAIRAGELAVDVRVDEVRVQDLRADAREVRGDLPERDRVDVGPEPDLVERDAPARSASANSHAPGSSSWSMRKRTSQPRSRRSGRSCRRCASEPEIPATFWVWRTTPPVTTSPPRRGATAHADRVARRNTLAKRCSERRLSAVASATSVGSLGQRARVPAREPLLGRQELVEDRV